MNNRFTMLTIFLLTFFMAGVRAQNGEVTWEKFNLFSGTFADLSTAQNPDVTQTLSSIDAPQNVDDNYSARITGYIVPAETGDYTFYVASDDGSEFWLSTDISSRQT